MIIRRLYSADICIYRYIYTYAYMIIRTGDTAPQMARIDTELRVPELSSFIVLEGSIVHFRDPLLPFGVILACFTRGLCV